MTRKSHKSRRHAERSRFSRFAHHARIPLLAFLVLTGLKWTFHESAPLEWLRRQAYAALQSVLQVDTARDLPIVLVDISRLNIKSPDATKKTNAAWTFGTDLDYTPRPALSNLVYFLSRARPAALGIDIDFSPELNGAPPPPGQEQFLDFCKDLKDPSGVPSAVFLGVGRAVGYPPPAWLGSKALIPLAATTLRFHNGDARMPTEIRYASDEGLPSLSQALAANYIGKGGEGRSGLAGKFPRLFHERSREEIGPEGAVEITSIYVNYNFKERLQRDANARCTAEEILALAEAAPAVRDAGERALAKKIQNKMVLIGDATVGESRDTAHVPWADTIPGVFTHACAACTLVEFPMWEMDKWAGAGIALLLLLGLLWLDWWAAEQAPSRMWLAGIAVLFAVANVLLIFLVAVLFGRVLHVLWLDSVSILLAALVECAIVITFESFLAEENESKTGSHSHR